MSELAMRSKMQINHAEKLAVAAEAAKNVQDGDTVFLDCGTSIAPLGAILMRRKVRIVIPSGRSKHDRMPVILGVNGREYLIVRDREIAVPEGVVNVLNLAREKVAVPSEVNGQQVVEWEEAQRIPFQILGYVEPAGR